MGGEVIANSREQIAYLEETREQAKKRGRVERS